jgi:hypothetical protein
MAELVRYSTKLTHKENKILSIRPTKKLSEATDDEVRKAIFWAVTLVGITQTAEPEHKMVTVHFLKTNWGNVELNHFVKAFEMVAAGDFEDTYQEHYNSLSSMYISKVLKRYQRYVLSIKEKANRVSAPGPDFELEKKLRAEENKNVKPGNLSRPVRDFFNKVKR